MKTDISKVIRPFLVIGGFTFLILTIGFFFQLTWAITLWPWKDGRLSYIFISSITAAIAVPNIWIGLSREYGSAKGGAINLGAMAFGTSLYLLLLYSQNRETRILVTAIFFALFFLLASAIFIWSKNIPIRDTRSMPGLVRVSFLVFSIILILTGIFRGH